MASDVLDSNWMRVASYAVVTIAALLQGTRDRARARTCPSPALWVPFWFLTAAVLAVLALARATDVGEVIAGLGRRRARAEGWYDVRREYQAIAVGLVTSVWGVSVLLAIWRVPDRRRRYLPAALVVATIVGFGGVRMISLHQIDALLYNRSFSSVRVVAIVELSLLALTLITVLWATSAPRMARREQPAPGDGRASDATQSS